MPQEKEETTPLARRSGRDDSEPRNQPGEFADDMATNRFNPPPDPGEEKGD